MLSIIILYYNIIILWDHRRICGPSLTETSLCGPYLLLYYKFFCLVCIALRDTLVRQFSCCLLPRHFVTCPVQFCLPQLCADCVWQVRISVSRLSRSVGTITIHSLVKQTSENDSSAVCRQTYCLLIRVVSPTVHYVAITLAYNAARLMLTGRRSQKHSEMSK